MNMISTTGSAIVKKVGGFLSGRGNAKLTVLLYHRVLPRPDPLRPTEPDVDSFAWRMRTLSRFFNVFPLGTATRMMREGRLPERAVSITFDDGYADNVSLALPILLQFGLSATFFVASGFLNGGRMWNDTVIESLRLTGGDGVDLTGLGLGVYGIDSPVDRCRAIAEIIRQIKYLSPTERVKVADGVMRKAGVRLPDDLMMRSTDLRSLVDAGMEIGGHTISHPILAEVDAQIARAEIFKGKEMLEGIIDRSITVFAYPNGTPNTDYRERDVRLVEESGFDAAVTTSWGVASNAVDRFQLPRFTPWDDTPERFVLRLFHNYMRTRPELC